MTCTHPLSRLLTVCLAATLHCQVALAEGGTKASVERMYVLECGRSITPDVSANWSPGVDVGVAREFSDNCYLIRHQGRWLLWDTGMNDDIAAKPEGVSVANGLLRLFVERTLVSQLKALGLAPEDITDLALSHFHADHAGNARLFTRATLYVQKAESAAAFGAEAARFGFVPALYERIRDNPRRELDGDFDIFGDGAVVILATPGHTPGHQSLLVRLSRRGPVILSGDMVHFEENWQQRRIPVRNFDAAQTAASMQRVAQLLEAEGAQLWINHDKVHSDTIVKAPTAVE